METKNTITITLLLLVFAAGFFAKDFLSNETVTLENIKGCKDYYEEVKTEYWNEDQEGRFQIIYSPKLKSCLVANFYNYPSPSEIYWDLDKWELGYTEEEWIEKRWNSYDTRGFGMIVDLNKGKVLTHYTHESGEHSSLKDVFMCSYSYSSLEKEGLFGTNETESCDNKKDLLTDWINETKKYGFSKW